MSIQLKPLFHKKEEDPVNSIIRDIFKDNNYALSVLGTLSLGLGISQSNHLTADDDDVEEIIVTASKKEQNIQDVAMSVQAIGASELEKKNIKSLEDISSISPAVTFNNVGPGKSNFYIRGVSDGAIMNSYASPESTTALYIDEQPLTAASLTPDLHIYDIERVEVLMGPQGTLYGSSSTSGNIKIITKKPDPSGFDAGADIEYGSITDGDVDTSLEAFINLPLGSNLAARVSAYNVEDGGWIDNKEATYTYQNSLVNHGITDPNGNTINNYTAPHNVAQDDYNDSKKEGARIRLATNNDNFNIDLSFLTQESYYNGSYETDVLTDDQSAPMPPRSNTRFTDERYDDEFEQFSATLSGNLSDNIEFILNTSIFERDTAYTYDYSSYVEYYYYAAYAYYTCNTYYDSYYSAYYADVTDCRDPRMSYSQSNDIERESTEIRIQSDNDSGFNWVLGAFSETNEKITDVNYIQPGNYGLVDGKWWEADLDRKGEIDAVFGEIYYDITDKASLTVGFRKYDQSVNLIASDGYYGTLSFAGDLPSGVFSSSEKGVIPKIALQVDISDDIMVYGTYTEGYRPSGVNRPRPNSNGLQVPETYDPDYLDNLEIGMKSILMDGRLTLNGAIYKMDWRDYQTSTYNADISSVAYTENVGNAEINGYEINANYSINDSSNITFYLNKNEPILSEDYYYADGELAANAGNRLASTPRTAYYISFDKDLTFMGKAAYLIADYSYTGERFTSYENGAFKLPDYAIANIRAGFDASDKTSIELYISNLTDEDAYLSRYDDFSEVGDSGYSGFGIRRTGSKPKVIGIRLRYKY
jgi:outer membrane receptor protein involved in Fe transport